MVDKEELERANRERDQARQELNVMHENYSAIFNSYNIARQTANDIRTAYDDVSNKLKIALSEIDEWKTKYIHIEENARAELERASREYDELIRSNENNTKSDCVLISEIYASYSQRRNHYNQLIWSHLHSTLIGHVGVLKSVDYQKEIGRVCVYASGAETDHYDISEVVCDWPLDALEIPKRLFFACGNAVVLTKGGDKISIGVISRLEFEDSGNIKYLVIAENPNGTYTPLTIDSDATNQIENEDRNIYLCPIYSGPRLNKVMREKNTPAIHSYKTVIHGFSVENLMNVISNWSNDSSSYSKFVESIRANPDQVRIPFEGELPLFRAVADDNWNLVVMLLSVGANKYAKDEKNRTIIHVAAQLGLDRMLEGVLTLLPKEVNRTTVDGDTPLHLAARNAHAACIDRLLATPTCLANLQNENGDSPLHELCVLAESANKKASISRLLTNSRASIHQVNNDNISPLQISILKGHVSTVEQLIQLRPPHRNVNSRTGVTPLHFAASVAAVNIVNVLISLGLEVHKKDKLGRGVLHYAVEKWTGQADKDMTRLACIQALVHSGAPANAVDVYGQTVLHVLVKEMMKQNDVYPPTLIPVCVQLVKTNLNLDEMASRLRPHWQLASACFLISNGADLNIKDRKGLTALDLANDSSLRPIFVHISGIKIKSCLPMVSLNCTDSFDSAEVTMCTFMCQDSIANVRFMPCGHRVACTDCAQKTAFRRCPLCYHIISNAQDDAGNEVNIGCFSGETPLERNAENAAISEQIKRKIAEEAAREAKIAVEQEKQSELKALRERLEELEMETSCAICMDAKISLVFNCGHTSCSTCAAKLKLCHICRKSGMALFRYIIPRRKGNVFLAVFFFFAFLGIVYYSRESRGQRFKFPNIEKVAERIVNPPTKWNGVAHQIPDYSKPRDGPGEMGKPVVLTGDEAKLGEEDMKKWFMNVHASDKISLDRDVPDARRKECKELKYDLSALPKASVIIIFTDEAWTPLLRTVHSVVNRSPPQLLEEVILLDDNSQREELKDQLDEHVKRFGGLVKIIRKNVRHGLIRAKLAGAREATGEVVVFLDSHCEANHGWLEPLVQRIHEKRSAIICPIIDSIAAETMAYYGDPFATSVGGFSWALHFTWEGMPEEERKRRKAPTDPIQSPTMAGGLLAASKEYFFEIGGYDEEMDIWGGENLEISFRTWMCGGSIEFIPCSHVGHIFRSGHPYNMTGRNNNKDVHGTNSKRLAEVWMDDYKRLYYMHRSDLRDQDVGDLTERKRLREKLNCKSFRWYLDNVAKGKFIMDEDVLAYGTLFTNVKNVRMCTDTLQRDEKRAYLLGIFYCQGKGSPSQLMSLSKEGNLRRETSCAFVEGNHVRMRTCSKKSTVNEKWTFENQMLRNEKTGKCLTTADIKSGDDIIVSDCDENDEHQKWNFVDPRT
ncbi:unnamed protein product [Caenorhabditis bovis]|uniref:RING-type domain-containing protein n=1 Tax=Caenorhabditis bovis TaxID=2654633 RepID=A0A8S1EES4_9PELO|nr:unnamed protein product [Caenorhabditis bovis]